MSGSVKAGLLFGLVGMVVIFGVSMVAQLVLLPQLARLLGGLAVVGSCTGPLTAIAVGAAAAYFAVRWSGGRAGVGTGVGASALAGIGLLLGGAAFFLVFFGMVMSDPEFRSSYQETVREQLAQQQPGTTNLTEEQFQVMLGLVGPLGGICIGTINLLFALLGGLLGGLVASRTRSAAPPPPTPMGPPPLSPAD